MFGKKYHIEYIDYEVAISNYPNIKAAKLIYVQGTGALSKYTHYVSDSYYGYSYWSRICLNEVPLIQINSPGCPTCSSVLATGYGIENAKCEELRKLQEKINAPFENLGKAIEKIEPLLGLLSSGLYMIADATCFPTDGSGNFFWNVPNEPVENPATAGVLLPHADYAYVSGTPLYLYPTQNTDCYSKERVLFYEKLYEKEENLPRAILYHTEEFMSFVLDGHHKACAAALTQKPLYCIVIIPLTATGYKPVNGKMEVEKFCFADITIPAEDIPRMYHPKPPEKTTGPRPVSDMKMTPGTICQRKWEENYLNSAKHYLSPEEYAEIAAAGLSCENAVENEVVENCLKYPTEENLQTLNAVLLVMRQRKDTRLKETAMRCAQIQPHSHVTTLAYEMLAEIKEDEEVEQFFIDYLVNCEDRYDEILPIVHSYWE